MQQYSAVRLSGVFLLMFLSGCVSGFPERSLREAVTLRASFDETLDADEAKGDKKLYGASSGSRMATATPGVPEGGAIELARGQGVKGNALRFTRKSSAVVFFKGTDNFNYQRTNWSGAISFWLKLDPDKDLQPGYCDPLQVQAGNWNNGVFFAEFSKDETPRHFRFAMRPLHQIYNPRNLGWESIPVKERPMIQVEKPPFSRESWTHVAFCFNHANTNSKQGYGKLYLNGKPAGEFKDWDLTLNWKPEEIQVVIGASYVGLFDELTLFNRELTPHEIQHLSTQKK